MGAPSDVLRDGLPGKCDDSAPACDCSLAGVHPGVGGHGFEAGIDAGVCAWAGLTPTVRSSDGRARLGHISQQGSPHIRWALVEAAQKAATGGGPLRVAFERIAKRRGRKIAKVALARCMLTLCYYGLRDGEIRCLLAPGPASARPVKAAR